MLSIVEQTLGQKRLDILSLAMSEPQALHTIYADMYVGIVFQPLRELVDNGRFEVYKLLPSLKSLSLSDDPCNEPWRRQIYARGMRKVPWSREVGVVIIINVIARLPRNLTDMQSFCPFLTTQEDEKNPDAARSFGGSRQQ